MRTLAPLCYQCHATFVFGILADDGEEQRTHTCPISVMEGSPDVALAAIFFDDGGFEITPPKKRRIAAAPPVASSEVRPERELEVAATDDEEDDALNLS